MSIWLRGLLSEFGPLVVFFIAEWWWGFFPALGVMLGATVLATLLVWYGDQRTPWFAILSTVGVLGFGLASVYWQEPGYFIISDTILDGVFAILLFGSLLWSRTLLERLFAGTFAITRRGWRILTWRWAIFFLILAVGNEYVRQWYDESVWVEYKLYSTIAILLFGCYQFTLSRRERLPDVSNAWGLRISSRKSAESAQR